MFGSRYIDPTTDFGFKRLFGQEDSKEILLSFLNAVLDLPAPIAELTYLPSEQLPEASEERGSVYDVYCVDTEARRFIVEMQRGKQIHFKERSLYYLTFPIVHQVRRGETQYPFALLPIYMVGVLNFALDEQPRYLRRVALREETGELFYPKLTLVYIELPKFRGPLRADLPLVEQWVYVLRHLPSLMDIPLELDQLSFDQVFRKAEEAALSPTERLAYEASLKQELDTLGRIESARQEGLQEGLETGREEGREEAVTQTKATIARTMLAEGLDPATVARVTGLSLEEVQAL